MYNRILLPLDGSAIAEQALPHAIALAQRFQAELILLRILEPLAEKLGMTGEIVKYAEDVTREVVEKYMENACAEVQERGLRVKSSILEGRPHTEIVRFAETEQVDLIVISTRGQSGLSRWLMGSVADRVARGVSVPVLLVRSQKAE
jgi:nucleotide-binding universal stress UspA family protein